MYIPTFYYGNIPIEPWEIPAFLILMIVVWLISGTVRRRQIKQHSEYTYFLWGLWAKIAGGIFFGLIYIFYYRGGDTIGYFSSAYSYCELFHYNLNDFWTAYFGPVSQETLSVFSSKTGEPLGYMYFNDQTRVVIKLLVPFMLVSGKSYFISGALVSILTYTGAWRLYQTFVRCFPGHQKNLALAILFMPSVVFWGSGISKDSYTLAGSCFFLSTISLLIDRKGSLIWNVIILLLSAGLIILIKPYILLILLPGTLTWILYSRIQNIRNSLLRYSIVPFTYLAVIMGSYGILSALGGSFGKFSIDKALETAVVSQRDLKQEYYEGNSFDIGEFEPTLTGVFSRFPAATIAGLFRPYLWESRNIVMLLSGLENFLILIITLYVLFRLKWSVIYSIISHHPILLCSFVFSILFAFMIGLTTSNFGALVRFKIPLVPLYMSTILLLLSQTKRLRFMKKKKKTLISGL